MNWDRIEGNWKQFKGNAKQQWGKITDSQLEVISGKRDLLAGFHRTLSDQLNARLSESPRFFWVLVVVCIGLGYLGAKPAEGAYVIIARILTAYYFLHFLVILPALGYLETPHPLPASISEPVLPKSSGAAVAMGARAPVRKV